MAGCTSGASALRESIWIDGTDKTVESQLNPRLSYLRVGLPGRSIFMVLGYTEPHSLGTIETWYSAMGEVIRLQNGRIVGTAGLPTDWREVRLAALPGWTQVPSEGLRHIRQRDLEQRQDHPRRQHGIQDQLHLRPLTQAPVTPQLKHPAPMRLRWFEERTEHSLAPLPPVRFAVDADTHAVVYSEQCLAPNLCFNIQPWHVAAGTEPTH